MKKIMSMLAAMLLFAVAASAVTPADLAGTRWKSKKIEMPSPEESVKVNVVVEYAFGSDQAVSDKQDVTMSIYDKESKMKIDVFLTVSADGTYTAEGDSITMKADMATLKVECEDDDIRVTFPGGESNAIMESMIKGQMSQMIDMLRKEVEKGFAEPTVLRDVKINGKKATCESDKINFEFSIKKI